MKLLNDIRLAYFTSTLLILLVLLLDKSFAIASLVVSYSLLIFTWVKQKDKSTLVVNTLVCTAQYGLLLLLLLVEVGSWLVWMNILLLVLVGLLTGKSINASRDSRPFIVHVSLVLITAVLGHYELNNFQRLQAQHQLAQQLTKNLSYWSAKADSIQESIQMRNPDPLLSIWMDTKQADQIVDQLLYSRKVLTEQVTHDFFLEPETLLQKQSWAADTMALANWWLNSDNTKPAIEDYQYVSLAELVTDFTSYQQFQLEALDDWISNQPSVVWFYSLESNPKITAIEASQGLLYLAGTVQQMITYKLLYFDQDEFPKSFAEPENNPNHEWQQVIEQEPTPSSDLNRSLFAILLLLTLGIFIPKLTFRLTGIGVLLILGWLYWNTVAFSPLLWVPLVLLGIASIVLEWRMIGKKNEAA